MKFKALSNGESRYTNERSGEARTYGKSLRMTSKALQKKHFRRRKRCDEETERLSSGKRGTNVYVPKDRKLITDDKKGPVQELITPSQEGWVAETLSNPTFLRLSRRLQLLMKGKEP
jgi:hypothetical protein